MLVLHGGVLAGRLLVWGEASLDSAGPEGKPQPRRGRQKSAAFAPSHPYDAGGQRLLATLAEVGISAETETAAAVAWLPSADGAPIASSPFIAGPAATTKSASIAPWLITALRPTLATAVDLLCASMDRHLLSPGVTVGQDLAFASLILKEAAALVAAQQFLPGIAQTATGRRAVWDPVLLPDDQERLARLQRAMPPSVRAVSNDNTAAPQEPVAKVLRAFLNALVDHLVRSSAPEQAETPRRDKGSNRKRAAHATLHDAWLAALRSEDGQIEGSEPSINELADQVHGWRRPLDITTSAPLRLCLRLEEPAGDVDHDYGAESVHELRPSSSNGSHWHVSYLLQAADDPSLLVGVREVAQARGRKASVFRRGDVNVQEYLLSALGQAAAICPRIEASLKSAEPTGYELDCAGAYEFLSERALALRQAGFGVLLPSWWTGRGTRLRLSAQGKATSRKMKGGSGLTLDDLVRFQWQVALGDEQLSLSELQELARLKSPLVRIRGQWVQVGAADIAAALEMLKKGPQSLAARDVLRMALGAGPSDLAIPLTGVKAEGWLGEVLAKLEDSAKLQELPAPASFTGTLRPYQARGYSWMAFLREWGLGACLADDMGLGKTVQTLALLAQRWEQTQQPSLLICPTSLVGNWAKEAQRFAPELPIMVHHGTARSKGAAFKKAVAKQALVLSSYSLVHRDSALLEQMEWDSVILDEAQNIKNAEAKQSKAARSLHAAFRLALTGTPVENNVGDLWSINEFLNPGWLGTQADFKRRFFIPIQARRDPDAAARLKQLTGPLILRRLKTDKSIIADLPDKLEMKVFCTLTKEQASLYEAVVKDVEESIFDAEGIERKGLVLATLSKLKQVCNHPAQFLGDNSAIAGRSGKLARLVEMLDEIRQIGERALVFTQFSEMGELLQKHLQDSFGQEVLFLHGGVTAKKRGVMVERFQAANGSGPSIFVLSLKAGGTGLNLTRANHVFHYDRWWNPAVENQATDRAFRIGQTKNVQVHKFLCAGTLEEKIDEMIERKREVAEQVVGAGEGWLTELSNAELKEMFQLRASALAE